jgi:hypothetical protein
MINYEPTSPYSKTVQLNQYVSYLDFWTAVAIPPSTSDLIVRLETKYNKRPDLLSQDLYGTPQLWWVFACRNPDIIKDPIYDFKPNIVIYAPVKDVISRYI